MTDGAKENARTTHESLIDRERKAAHDHGIEIEAVGPDTPPETLDQVVADLINVEYVAKDIETGETARGESLRAAWANLRGISKREVHNKSARWHRDRDD